MPNSRKSGLYATQSLDLIIFRPEDYGPPPVLPVFNEWNQGALPYARNCLAHAYNALNPELGPVKFTEPHAAALQQFRVTLPNPGYMGGNPMQSITPGNLRNALISDGCLYIPNTDQKSIKPLKEHYLIAAYSYSDGFHGSNFHFYRKHGDLWYSKPGWGNESGGMVFVTPYSRAGEIIADPQKDRMIAGQPGRPSPYQLAGFFWVPNEGIKLDIKVEPLPPVPRSRISWPSHNP